MKSGCCPAALFLSAKMTVEQKEGVKEVPVVVVHLSEEDKQTIARLGEAIRLEQVRLEREAVVELDKKIGGFASDRLRVLSHPAVRPHLPFLAFYWIAGAFESGRGASVGPINYPDGRDLPGYTTIKTYNTEDNVPWEQARSVFAKMDGVGRQIIEAIEKGCVVRLEPPENNL